MAGKKEEHKGPGEPQGILSVEPVGYRQLDQAQDFLQLLNGLLTGTVWVAKTAKNHFYELFSAAAQRPQKIAHRDGRHLVVMSEAVYGELLAGWKVAREPHSLADRFRETKITQAVERPGKFKQRRPRALDLAGAIDGSGNIRKPRKSAGTREAMKG